MLITPNIEYAYLGEKSAVPTVIDPTVELKNTADDLKSDIDESKEKIDINTIKIESLKYSIERLEENQEFLSNDITDLNNRTNNNIGNVYSYIRNTHNKIEDERLEDMSYIKDYIIKAVCLSSSVVFVLNIIINIIINFFNN